MTTSHCDQLLDQGFTVLPGLLSPEECEAVVQHEGSRAAEKPIWWPKGRGAADHFYYCLAGRDAILSLAKAMLGPNVILWGVDVLRRAPNQVHPWHCDIESSHPQGGFLSIWIGIENVSHQSALNCVSRSHRFGMSIQEKAHAMGVRRNDVSRARVEAWAKELDAKSQVIEPDVHAGDAIAFDGRLWHGTHNLQEAGVRFALLIQYAAADRPVRMYDPKQLEWPFSFLDDGLPPVVVMAGEGDPSRNQIVAAPKPEITEVIRPLAMPLQASERDGWVPYFLFDGKTPHLSAMGCHVSVLSPGHSPHPPHQHVEEELLIVLDGEAEIVLPRSEDDPNPRAYKLAKGMFSYYPPGQFHTIRNNSSRPVTYLMFKWRARKRRDGTSGDASQSPLFTSVFDCRPQLAGNADDSSPLLFDMATAGLRRLHCHVTRMPANGGYAAHTDKYDVAIVLLSGTIETQGKRLHEAGVAYFGAGVPHDMRNPSAKDAAYIVFEFEV